MNKSQVVKEVAKRADVTQADTSRVINAFLETVKEGVADGKRVEFVGFGSFVARNRAARKGRNPQTGEEIEISARRIPAFKAGKSFKDLVKE